MNAIDVIVSEEKKPQTRKVLKAIHHSLPQLYYSERVQWRAIENVVDKDFIVTYKSSIIAEKKKYK